MIYDNRTSAGTLRELYLISDELLAAVEALLDQSVIHYEDINRDSSSAVFLGWNPHRWRPLNGPIGQRALGEARRLEDLWAELASKAICAGAPERKRDFEEPRTMLNQVLRRESGVSAGAPGSSVDAVRAMVADALNRQRRVLADLPTAHGEERRLLVPDTNALLYQPAVEEWRAADGPWTAVIVPQVIRELDSLKLGERPVAEVAETVIRRLKEYGRRGDTFSGVPLKHGVQLREVPVDANMSDTLSWLRPGHADDELLASVLELKWENLQATVVLVTRDRNLQNKARMARTSYVDVEDIAAPRPSRSVTKPRRDAEEAARTRLAGGLPFVAFKLGVPGPGITHAGRQSWTVQAAPLNIAEEFASRVLSPDAPKWFEEQATGLLKEPPSIPQRTLSPEAGARGFAVRREFTVPPKGSILLVVDAGGLVGTRYNIELTPDQERAILDPKRRQQRALALRAVEEEYLRPLVQSCADALGFLGADGPALIEVWAMGVGHFVVRTDGHVALNHEQDGWLNEGVLHMGGELSVPPSNDEVTRLIQRWGRELARAAGIPAWER